MEIAETALRIIGRIIFWLSVALGALVILLLLFRWGYAEWYPGTRCTEILGTRVCR